MFFAPTAAVGDDSGGQIEFMGLTFFQAAKR